MRSYNKRRRYIRRKAEQGDPVGTHLWQLIQEQEAEGKSEQEITQAVADEIQRHINAFKPALLSMKRSVEGATGMTVDDYLWLRDYAPLDEEDS